MATRIEYRWLAMAYELESRSNRYRELVNQIWMVTMGPNRKRRRRVVAPKENSDEAGTQPNGG